MRDSFGSIKMMAVAIMAASCGALFSGDVVAAEKYRSFYQNAGANCHGRTSSQDNHLSRSTQSLLNNTSSRTVPIVCNLMTDGYAYDAEDSPNYGTVTSVIIWYRYLPGNSNTGITCSLVTSFAGDPGSTLIAPTSAQVPVGSYQGYFVWNAPSDARFLAPVNVECTLPPKIELNDWLVEYIEDVGD